MNRRLSPRSLIMLAAIGLLSLAAVACTPATQTRGWAQPVKTGDVLLVSTGKGRLDALNASTQTRLWRFPNDWSISDGSAKSLKGIYGAPVLSSDGLTIFVGDYNGYLYAFRPGDRTGVGGKPPAAALKLDGPVIGGLTLDPQGNIYVTSGRTLFKVSAAEMVRKIDSKDVKPQLTRLFETGGEIWSTPTLQDGKLLLASLDGNLYAVDPNSGAEIWRFTGTRSLASTPVVSGGQVLVGGFDTKLHSVDLQTGVARWSFTAQNWVWSSPIVESGRIYFGDFDGHLYAVELANGSEVWSEDLADSPIVGSPVLASGVLVVAGQDGTLFGLDPATRAERWSPLHLGTPYTADLVADQSTVYLAPSGCVEPDGGGTRTYYVSLDALTGSLRSTAEVC